MQRRTVCRHLCVCGAGLLAGCGVLSGGESTPTLDRASPKSVVRVYLHRLSEDDWDGVNELRHSGMGDLSNEDRNYYDLRRYEVKQLELVRETESEAVVRAKVRIDVEERAPRDRWIRFRLTSTDGGWLVAAAIRETDN